MDDDGYNEQLSALADVVAQALARADALELWDVSIGLDRARILIDRLSGPAPAAPVEPALNGEPAIQGRTGTTRP